MKRRIFVILLAIMIGIAFDCTAPEETHAASTIDKRIESLFHDNHHVKFSGDNRYGAALKTADALKVSLGVDKFKNIVVACGSNYPDALTGSYLAKVKSAPILLVDKSVEAKIADYIVSSLASGGTVYILGGTGAVSADFENRWKAKLM